MNRLADLLLRVGLAFSFLYPPIDAWSNPFTWLGYIPAFVADLPVIDMHHFLLLHAFGMLEIVLALWVLSGWRIAAPSALMGFLLLFIVVTNPSQFEVVFRDLAIAAVAFSLTLTHWNHSKERSPEIPA